MAAALEREIGDVEASYPCQVDLVHVGDVARDDRVGAVGFGDRDIGGGIPKVDRHYRCAVTDVRHAHA